MIKSAKKKSKKVGDFNRRSIKMFRENINLQKILTCKKTHFIITETRHYLEILDSFNISIITLIPNLLLQKQHTDHNHHFLTIVIIIRTPKGFLLSATSSVLQH